MNSYCSSLLFDHGPNPFTINLRNAASHNCNSCTTLWSGSSLELKLLNILPWKTTGWKQHPETDQIIRIECGTALLILASKKCILILKKRFITETPSLFQLEHGTI